MSDTAIYFVALAVCAVLLGGLVFVAENYGPGHARVTISCPEAAS